MTKRAVRRPNGELVQYAAVVDRQWWPEVGGVAASPRRCVWMRPITSPEDALRIGCDKHLGEGRDVSVVGTLRRNSIDPRELHVRTPRRDEAHQRREAGLANTQCCLCLRKVVEDDLHITAQDVLLKCFHDGQASIDLNVPLLLCRNLRRESNRSIAV